MLWVYLDIFVVSFQLFFASILPRLCFFSSFDAGDGDGSLSPFCVKYNNIKLCYKVIKTALAQAMAQLFSLFKRIYPNSRESEILSEYSLWY